jgi:hypothetical protein
MLTPQQVQTLQQLIKEDCKNSWEVIVKFLERPAKFFNDAMKASHTM